TPMLLLVLLVSHPSQLGVSDRLPESVQHIARDRRRRYDRQFADEKLGGRNICLRLKDEGDPHVAHRLGPTIRRLSRPLSQTFASSSPLRSGKTGGFREESNQWRMHPLRVFMQLLQRWPGGEPQVHLHLCIRRRAGELRVYGGWIRRSGSRHSLERLRER